MNWPTFHVALHQGIDGMNSSKEGGLNRLTALYKIRLDWTTPFDFSNDVHSQLPIEQVRAAKDAKDAKDGSS